MLADETGLMSIIDPWMHIVPSCMEAAGMGIMVSGAIIATAAFLYAGLVSAGWPDGFRRYRANLGRAILLGLELLVAADLIGTVAVTPSSRALRSWA